MIHYFYKNEYIFLENMYPFYETDKYNTKPQTKKEERWENTYIKRYKDEIKETRQLLKALKDEE